MESSFGRWSPDEGSREPFSRVPRLRTREPLPRSVTLSRRIDLASRAKDRNDARSTTTKRGAKTLERRLVRQAFGEAVCLYSSARVESASPCAAFHFRSG